MGQPAEHSPQRQGLASWSLPPAQLFPSVSVSEGVSEAERLLALCDALAKVQGRRRACAHRHTAVLSGSEVIGQSCHPAEHSLQRQGLASWPLAPARLFPSVSVSEGLSDRSACSRCATRSQRCDEAEAGRALTSAAPVLVRIQRAVRQKCATPGRAFSPALRLSNLVTGLGC